MHVGDFFKEDAGKFQKDTMEKLMLKTGLNSHREAEGDRRKAVS